MGPVYRQIVRSFAAVEPEAYALCPFLRARQFDVAKVFALLDGLRLVRGGKTDRCPHGLKEQSPLGPTADIASSTITRDRAVAGTTLTE